MNHWNRVVGKCVVAVIILAFGMITSVIGADQKASASQGSSATVFKNPADAYAQYIAGTTNPAVQSAAKDYLQQMVDRTPRDPDSFSGAWAELIAIYQQQKQTDLIVQLCAQHLGKETDPTIIMMITQALLDAYRSTGDHQNAVKTLNTFLERNRSQMMPENVVGAVKALSTTYAKNLGQTNEAVAAIDRELKLMQASLNQLGNGQDTNNIYAAALSLADAYIAINDIPNAEKALDELLEKSRSPGNFSNAWAKLIAIYQQQKQQDRIIQVCAQHLGKETDQNIIAMITQTLLDAYEATGDYQNAAKARDAFLGKNRSQMTPTNVVAAVKALSTTYAKNLGQTNEAVAAIDRELKLMQASLNQLGNGQDTNNIYAAALSLADVYVAINDIPNAEKALDELLGKSRSPDNFNSAWAKLIALYQQQKQPDLIIQLCAKHLEKETDQNIITMIAATLFGAYEVAGDYQNAAKARDAFLEKNRSQMTPTNVVAAVKALSTIYAKNLGQAKEAAAAIDRELKYISSTNTIPQQVELMNAKAEICYTTLKDLPAAAAEYRKITEMGGQVPDPSRSDASLKLAQLCKEMGQTDQAAKPLLDYLKKPNAASSSAMVQKLIDVDANEQQLMEAVWLLREKVAAQSGDTTAVELYQPDIVKLLVKAGRRQEALQEARVFIYTCSDKTMPTAMDIIAGLFKTFDLNLGRANTFLKYQKYGSAGEDGKPGTDDDLTDILKDIPPLSDERRTKLFKASLDNLPKDWLGYKKRGDICLYLDQPVEAFQAYRKSFELCPLTEKELQTATDSLTACIIRVTREVPLAEVLVRYVLLGPAGKDGKAGTADDLKDPTPEIIKKIQYNQQQRAAPEPAAKPAKPVKATPAAPVEPGAEPEGTP